MPLGSPLLFTSCRCKDTHLSPKLIRLLNVSGIACIVHEMICMVTVTTGKIVMSTT